MHETREARITSPIVTLGGDAYRLMPVAGVVGLVGIGGGLAWSLVVHGSLQRFFYAYLTNYCFFASISLGALFFVAVQHLTQAGWSVTVRRIAEILAMGILPLALLFLPIAVPLLLGYDQLYIWNAAGWSQRYAGHVLHGIESLKAAYLSPLFFVLRSAGYFAVWSWMAWTFFRRSLRQDRSGDPRLTAQMQRFAAPTMILFAATLVFAAFDWEMSLQPMWFSTIFPVYFFAGSVLGGLSTIALTALLLQRSGRVTDEITVEHLHDLGKLMFTFIVFWGYIAFSQFLLIWYANIPEETFWFKYRFLNGGWRMVTWILLFGHLLVPLLLVMPRTFKRHRGFMIAAALYLLAMHWLDHFWLVMPQMAYDGRDHAAFALSLGELLMLVGFTGLFVGFFCLIAADRPLVPLRDPRLGEALHYSNF